jgi:hypothetical protein
MKVIKLFNRDGADLRLVQTDNNLWELSVDEKHKYVREFCRYIGDNFLKPEAIDPSGGPMINLGDEFENRYKIVKINSINNIWISDNGNNK